MSRILFILSIFAVHGSGLAIAEGGLSFGNGCDTVRIGKSPDMQRAFRAISAKIGQSITLNSCFRSQSKQNEILERNGCYPYGKKNCNGTVATRSYHTYGIAGDYSVKVATTPLCKAMDEVRREMMGGLGGVGGYGAGAAHFDNRNYRCSYNICGSVIGGGCSGNSRGTRKAGFDTPLGSSDDTTDSSGGNDTPYTSAKVDEYNKSHVGGNGIGYWLRWLLRVLTFGLIKL